MSMFSRSSLWMAALIVVLVSIVIVVAYRNAPYSNVTETETNDIERILTFLYNQPAQGLPIGNRPVTSSLIVEVTTQNKVAQYPQLAEAFSEDAIPAMRDILNDPQSTEHWYAIVRLMSFFEDSAAASDALINFIEKDERTLFDGSPAQDVRGNDGVIFRAKVRAVRMLGWTGGDHADDVLGRLITEGGAKKVIAGWFDEAATLSADRDSSKQLHRLRANAARGIAIATSKDNVGLLEDTYNHYHEIVTNRVGRKLAIDERRRDTTKSERNLEILYDGLVEAMAVAEFVSSHDRQQFRRTTLLDSEDWGFKIGSSVQWDMFSFPYRNHALPKLTKPVEEYGDELP